MYRNDMYTLWLQSQGIQTNPSYTNCLPYTKWLQSQLSPKDFLRSVIQEKDAKIKELLEEIEELKDYIHELEGE